MTQGGSTPSDLLNDPAWVTAETAGPLTRSALDTAPPAGPHRPAAPPTFVRIFRGFALARAVLGGLLLALQAGLSLYSSIQPAPAVLLLCLVYALASVALMGWTLSRVGTRRSVPLSAGGRLRRRWAVLTLGFDLVCFTGLLVMADATGGLNLGALFVLPALMGAALLPRPLSLAVAAGGALLLLAAAVWHAASDSGVDLAAQLSQAGLTGAAMLTIAYLTSELADRLARQEVTARRSLVLAREQAQLNQLMIEEMQDGVMVVDPDLQVRAANPAALTLIGARAGLGALMFSLRESPDWQPLCRALELAYASGVWPVAGQVLTLRVDAGGSVEKRHLRLRLRFNRKHDGATATALCVLFLEDMRQLQARARQEKLAAMGRISAGIAHEIRNPLAAIAQANALLAEDLADVASRRLTGIVTDNVGRLQRIVEDVLEVAPGSAPEAPLIDLPHQVATICRDWAATVGLQPPDRLQIDLLEAGWAGAPLTVRFEPDALRRVLINLLDNGLRHCSDQPQALRVRLQARGSGEVVLSVASDGAPIAADVEPYLFEPFFSTRSRGSGLGLYICRELCERHGAAIDYRSRGPAARHRNVFLLTLPRVLPADGDEAGPPDAKPAATPRVLS